ncbi:acyltransferase family protein [Mycetocola tolaasinivorans]|nr:acyltransferase family protein [Mycetocola tolaasinivorans]
MKIAPGASRLHWIDALRGVAIILVIFLHASLALKYYSDAYPRSLRGINLLLEPFRMPLLVFLAGYFVTRSLRKGAVRYFTGKIRHVVWPYLIWSFVGLFALGTITPKTALRVLYDPVETHLWYLWFLPAYYFLAWALKRVPAWIPGMIALIASHWMPEDIRLEKFVFLFAFFMFGVYFSTRQEAIESIIERRPVVITAALLAVATGLVNLSSLKVLYEPLYAPGLFGSIIVAVWLFRRIPPNPVSTALEFVGRNSLIYYVSHLVPIHLTGFLMRDIGYSAHWPLFAVFLTVGFGTGTAFALLSARFAAVRILFEAPPFTSPPARAARQIPAPAEPAARR